MLSRILLHLARNRDFPEGSSERGYEIVAPLTGARHLDVEAWRKHRSDCRVRRFWTGAADRYGRLVHHAGGPGGATWRIDYDDMNGDGDDAAYRLDAHRFEPNEYVTIREADGSVHTFRVAQVRPA